MSLCGFFKKYFLFILPSSSVDAAVESAASRVAIYRGNSVKSPGGHMPPNLDVHFQFTCGWYIPILLLLLLLSLFCPLRSSLSLLEFFFLAAWSQQEKKTFFFLFPPPPDQIAPSSSIYIYAQAWHYMTSSSILLFPYILFSLPSTENLRPLSDDRPRQKRFVTFLTGLDHHPHI